MGKNGMVNLAVSGPDTDCTQQIAVLCGIVAKLVKNETDTFFGAIVLYCCNIGKNETTAFR